VEVKEVEKEEKVVEKIKAPPSRRVLHDQNKPLKINKKPGFVVRIFSFFLYVLSVALPL